MARMISFVLLVAIIILLGLVFFRVMAAFLLPLFLSALLCVIFKPVHRYILLQCGFREALAATLTTAAILLIVLAPIGLVMSLAIGEAAELASHDWSEDVERVKTVRRDKGFEMPHAEKLFAIRDELDELRISNDVGTAAYQSHVDREQETVRRQIETTIQLANALSDDMQRELAGLPPATEDAIKRRYRDRAKAAQPHLEQLNARLLPALLEQVTAHWQELSDDEYSELLTQVDLAYSSYRQVLLGGPIFAPLIELANPSKKELRTWRVRGIDYMQKWAISITGQTTGWLIGLLFGVAIMVIGVFYFLIDGPAMVQTAMRLSPLDDDHERQLIEEFDSISRAVVLATLLSAVVQGLLAGVGYYFTGLGSLFLLIAATTILAMVPFVGAAAVWIPACLYLALIKDQTPQAIGLAIYGFVIVSMADNVIKPWVLHGQSKLHPLLALLSVLGGVQALGPIGLLVGPMVVSFLQALLNILQQELEAMAEEQTPELAVSSQSSPPLAKAAAEEKSQPSKKQKPRRKSRQKKK